MTVLESIRMAMRSLMANKLRAGLTMLGIVIGTGAVIALLSVGEGAQAEITGQIESIGSNLIFVFSGNMTQQQSPQSTVRVEPLTLQDAEALADPSRAPHVAAVAPEIDRAGTVTYHNLTTSPTVVGTTPEYSYVRNYQTAYGSFFTTADLDAAARVAVIGSETANVLFGSSEAALQQEIRINRVPFTVVGVLESKGSQGFGSSGDNMVIIPITTAMRRLYSSRVTTDNAQRVDMISVSATDGDSIDAAIDEVTWILRQRHKIEYAEDDFTVTSQQEILGVLSQITSVLTIFLGAIAGISLLVGGIGIMNIMLVSVTERTREIGIRKAVGAKRRDILGQFLIESIVLSVLGGLIGIAFGWVISMVVNQLGSFTTYVSPKAVLLAVSFSIAVGLFFGIYPASRASNLNPIQALRYE